MHASCIHAQVHDVLLSKHLSKLLRHKAYEHGVEIDRDGWALVEDVLRYANSAEAGRSQQTIQQAIVVASCSQHAGVNRVEASSSAASEHGLYPAPSSAQQQQQQQQQQPRRSRVQGTGRWQELDVLEMVRLSNKRRFELREGAAGLLIRATQV